MPTLYSAPIIGGLSALVVLITYLFVLKDFEEVVSSSSGPLLTILYQATSSRAGATALFCFPVVRNVCAFVQPSRNADTALPWTDVNDVRCHCHSVRFVAHGSSLCSGSWTAFLANSVIRKQEIRYACLGHHVLLRMGESIVPVTFRLKVMD